LEVAIILMQDKIYNLRKILEQNPPDAKLLQMQLQGGIATAVNQVVSPILSLACIHHTSSFSEVFSGEKAGVDQIWEY